MMKRSVLFCLGIVGILIGLLPAQDVAGSFSYEVFKDPPAEFGGVRWVTLNLSNVTEANLLASIQKAAQNHSAGSFELGPTKGPTTGLSAFNYPQLGHRVESQERCR